MPIDFTKLELMIPDIATPNDAKLPFIALPIDLLLRGIIAKIKDEFAIPFDEMTKPIQKRATEINQPSFMGAINRTNGKISRKNKATLPITIELISPSFFATIPPI